MEYIFHLKEDQPRGPSSLVDAPVGDVEEMVDGRHKDGQVPLVDAALGESCAEEFKHLDPLLDVVRFGGRWDFDALLDDTDRAFDGCVVGLPGLVPAGWLSTTSGRVRATARGRLCHTNRTSRSGLVGGGT